MNYDEFKSRILKYIEGKRYSEEKILEWSHILFNLAKKNDLFFETGVINAIFSSPNIERTLFLLPEFLNLIEKNLKDQKVLSVLCNLISLSDFAYSFIKKNTWVCKQIASLLLNDPYQLIIIDQNGNNSFSRNLKITKNIYYLAIAYNESIGKIAIERVLERYSLLSDFLINLVVSHVLSHLEKIYGKPFFIDENGKEQECNFLVMGLGKLGGVELNYSSDIDIMFLYSSDNGKTNGLTSKSITLSEYYSKCSQMITEILGEISEDGFLYRVDLNLRPQGGKGEIASSIRSAELYYNYYGSTWERAMLLKARFIAGERELYNSFIISVRDFVIKRHLDFETVDDFREMKREIDANAREQDSNSFNVKNGSGGIREIEFFVQTLILANCGKIGGLISNNTRESIRRLEQNNLISKNESEELIESYLFLRRVENAIQFTENLHKHAIMPSLHLKIALMLGYDNLHPEFAKEKFERDLQKVRKSVIKLYSRLFYDSEGEGEGNKFDIFDEEFRQGELESKLRELGVNETQKIMDIIFEITRVPSIGRIPHRIKENIRKVVRITINIMVKLPEREMALILFLEFLRKNKLKGSLMSLLANNTQTLKFLVNLFGTSQFLSSFLISRPEILDSVVMSNEFRAKKSKREVENEFKEALSKCQSIDEKIEILRILKNEEILRIGINDINKKISIESVGLQLSLLADVVLKYSTILASEMLTKKFVLKKSKIAILGMGKLGASELTYTSDLDLVFVYDEESDEQEEYERGKGKEIPTFEYYTKLAEKIIMILSMHTCNGILYQIDMRLRPSGNQGVLVVSQKSFIEYHKRSELWEKQALLRSRFVFGDKEIINNLNNSITESIFKDFDLNNIKLEIKKMREKMIDSSINKNQANFIDIKNTIGGIVDIEFIIQFLKFKYGKTHLSLLNSNTLTSIRKCAKLGILTREDARRLTRSYIFLRRIENGIKLITTQSTSVFQFTEKNSQMLGLYMGFRGDDKKITDAFKLKLTMNMESVRYFYKSYFD